jgi:hypothetical protein
VVVDERDHGHPLPQDTDGPRSGAASGCKAGRQCCDG